MERAFLTGGSITDNPSSSSSSSCLEATNNPSDQRFYQAIDEVERIRKRILMRAAVNTTSEDKILLEKTPGLEEGEKDTLIVSSTEG